MNVATVKTYATTNKNALIAGSIGFVLGLVAMHFLMKKPCNCNETDTDD